MTKDICALCLYWDYIEGHCKELNKITASNFFCGYFQPNNTYFKVRAGIELDRYHFELYVSDVLVTDFVIADFRYIPPSFARWFNFDVLPRLLMLGKKGQ